MSSPAFVPGLRWGFRLESDDEAARLTLSRVVDLAIRADRWREVTAYLDGAAVPIELGEGETLADALEAAAQDLATEDLCFNSEAEEALARVAVDALRAELEGGAR